MTFRGPGDRPVHAVVYPPHNPDFVAPEGELPPYVAFVHGGPTSPAGAVDGGDVRLLHQPRHRRRRRQLRRLDRVRPRVPGAAARAVGRRRRRGHRRRRAGPRRRRAGRPWPARDRGRFGRRAGRCCRRSPTTDVFACGTSFFGVAELVQFAQDTHDFESRYLDGLIGPLPEARRAVRQPGAAQQRRRAVLPGAAAAGAGRPDRAAVAGRDVPRRPGGQGHPARVPRLRGRVARLPQAGDDHRLRASRSCRSTARSWASRRPGIAPIELWRP